MCGVTGIAFMGTLEHEKEVERQKIAWYIATELLIATQIRGEDATGIAAVFDDGYYIGLKMGIMASEFVARTGGNKTDYNGFFKIWKKAMERTTDPKYAKLFLGHCRKTTVGSVWDNNNNHPIHVEPIVGVHNGTISNHDVIFSMLNKERIGNVDSESIFQLLHTYTDGGKEGFSKGNLTEVTRRLHGSYAVIASNTNNPNQVALFRDARPLVLSIIKPLGLIVISSEESLFQIALYRYNKEVQLYDGLYDNKRNWPIITKKEVETITLKDDHFSILNLATPLTKDFDIDKLVPQHPIVRVNKIWEKKHTTYYSGYEQGSVDNRSTQKHSATTNVTADTVRKNDKNVAGYLWIDDSSKYKELTEEELKELDEINSLEIEIDNIETNKTKFNITKSEKDTFEIGSASTRSINELVIKGHKSTAQEIEAKEERTVCVDMETDPEALKRSSMYANAIPVFENTKEIAEAMGLSNVKDLESLPTVSLVNKVRKVTAETSYYDAYKEAVFRLSKEVDNNSGVLIKHGKKRDVLVASIKSLIKLLAVGIKNYENDEDKRVGSLSDFVMEAVTLSKEKIYVEDIKSLFTEKDLFANELLLNVYNKLPSRRPEEK